MAGHVGKGMPPALLCGTNGIAADDMAAALPPAGPCLPVLDMPGTNGAADAAILGNCVGDPAMSCGHYVSPPA